MINIEFSFLFLILENNYYRFIVGNYLETTSNTNSSLKWKDHSLETSIPSSFLLLARHHILSLSNSTWDFRLLIMQSYLNNMYHYFRLRRKKAKIMDSPFLRKYFKLLPSLNFGKISPRFLWGKIHIMQ